MRTLLLRLAGTLFPVHRHEWPKALMLLSVAVLPPSQLSGTGRAEAIAPRHR